MDQQFATLKDIETTNIKLTPMMEQYFAIKKNYPTTLLFFRMGDFYELFFEDAVMAAKILDITVTHRGKLGEVKIPMAGIPHHAAHNYIDRITARGKKVAICEQTEDPKQAKGIVKRAVTQVVSPGIPYNLDRADDKVSRFIFSAVQATDGFFYSVVDFTTGEFFGEKVQSELELVQKIDLIKPQEFICFLGQWDRLEKLNHYLSESPILKTHLSQEYFNPKFTDHYIAKIMPAYKSDKTLKQVRDVLAPIGALSYYICSTQSLEDLTHFKPFKLVNKKNKLKVTAATLTGLEILPRSQASRAHSLIGFMDKTKTPMGARFLSALFQSPSQDQEEIEKRLDQVEYLTKNSDKLKKSRTLLNEIRDLDRILAKATTGKINPGDLLNTSRAIDNLTLLQKLFKDNKSLLALKLNTDQKSELQALKSFIDEAINDEVGANLDKGNLIKEGFSKERDRLANLSFKGAKALLDLEEEYRKKTGIANLRIRSNNLAGYFIEVSKSHSEKAAQFFERKQTLKNTERYLSSELVQFEQEITISKDKLYKLEREIFTQIVKAILKLATVIQSISFKIAEFDITQSFAWIAIQYEFTKPIICTNHNILKLTQAWHPLIKESIQDQFVHHNLELNEDKFFGLITGPNMAGKTTVMREAAIVQFLTQVGSFVPAKRAELSLKDYLFSRLGAHDDITRGQSTFMVEMSETAEILNHATHNSLVILDEIGRGTSTFDGMSIAWSLVEYFNDRIKAMTLFSTHYHELIELVSTIPTAKNLTVKTINSRGNVKFLYELIEEGAKQSFGIHVAKMAGLPEEVILRSREILKTIENKNTQSAQNELPLFRENQIEAPQDFEPIINQIKEIDLNNTTPMELMSIMSKIHKELKEQ